MTFSKVNINLSQLVLVETQKSKFTLSIFINLAWLQKCRVYYGSGAGVQFVFDNHSENARNSWEESVPKLPRLGGDPLILVSYGMKLRPAYMFKCTPTPSLWSGSYWLRQLWNKKWSQKTLRANEYWGPKESLIRAWCVRRLDTLIPFCIWGLHNCSKGFQI